MAHADDVIPWDPMPGPVTGSRTWRWWLLLAWLAVAALVVTEVTVQVQRFLWGGVPLTDMSPGFGTSGALGGSPFDTPVVSPDGRTLYVPSGTNSITPVATATRKAAPRIRLSGPGSVAAMAITPDSRTLFTAMILDSSTEPGLPLARVDLRTGRETGQVQVPGGAGNFVMSRDGRTLYVVSAFRFIVDRNSNVTSEVHSALYAVNAVTGRVERQLPVPAGALDDELTMVISPDGGTLYLANVPNSGRYTVTSVSLRTGEPGRTVGIDDSPTALAITPDGRTLYVTTSGMEGDRRRAGPNSVTAIDTATGQVRASLTWKAQPVAAISPDSQTLYVAVRSGLETFRVS